MTIEMLKKVRKEAVDRLNAFSDFPDICERTRETILLCDQRMLKLGINPYQLEA